MFYLTDYKRTHKCQITKTIHLQSQSFFKGKRIYEHLSEINLSEIIEDGKSAIKYLSNTSKIAETAEKVIGNAFSQQLENK